MLNVKICGITKLDDGILAAKLGADAIGFVFFEKSPRNISPKDAAKISRYLPRHVARVGVFVDPDPAFVAEAIETAGLDAVQLHGISDPNKLVPYQNEIRKEKQTNSPPYKGGDRFATRQPRSGDTVSKSGVVVGGEGFNHTDAALPKLRDSQHCPLILALPVKDNSISQTIAAFKLFIDIPLLDSYHPTLHGGTGKPFNWNYAAAVAKNNRIILAGGLTPENTTDAVKAVQPFAVDVSSGVEAAPGIKDSHKLKTFFENIKEYRCGWKPERNRLFPFTKYTG